MKKGLSLLLAASVAFSAFSATAFAAEPQTAQEKYDALVEAGIFEGFPDGEAHLDENMTRAQAAKIVALVLGLEENAAAASVYKDLKDAEWAAGFIGAATEAGVLNGRGNGVFDPSANVTIQELAKIMVEALDIEVDAEATAEGADEWAAPYVAAAVAAGLIAEQDDYTAPASRTILVEASYSAYTQTNVPDVASVTKAEATGVYKVQVTLDKAVDTAKATLTLKKGTLTVGSKTVWAEDKKSATLELDTRITAGEYTVTLGGLEESAVGTTTASFTAEDEKVAKLDFANASDTLPYSDFTSVEVVAENQYGEAVSIGAANFTALVSGTSVTPKKLASGNFEVAVDTKRDGITQGNGVIPVTVFYNNSSITVTKNFKVGTVPILSKIEVGEVKYSNNGTSLKAVGDKAAIALNLYDQYGNRLTQQQFTGGTPEVSAGNINPVITPYEANLEVVKADPTGSLQAGDLFDTDGNSRIEINLKAKMDKSAEYTVNIFGGAASSTATISVGASNLATKVDFDTSAVTIAADDTSVIIPLVATDANGNALTAQEIADNEARFTFTASNGTADVINTGTDKGKLKITFATVPQSVNSRLYVSGQIKNSQTNTFVQKDIAISETRILERIAVKEDIKPKAILGADDFLDFQLKDQYGKDRNDNIAASIPSQNGQTSSYRIVVEISTSGTGVGGAPATAPTATPTVEGSKTTYVYGPDEIAKFHGGFNVTSTEGAEGKVTVKAVVQKAVNGSTNYSDYSAPVSRTFEAIKSNTDLTYSVKAVGDLYAALDKLPTTGDAGVAVEGTPGDSQFDKKIEVIAKDAAGNEVLLPHNFVKGMTASDPNVVSVGNTGNDGYILGNKAGTATVTAIVYTNKGDTINLSSDVTVKADTIVVDKLETSKTSKDYSASILSVFGYFEKLTVTDQYGISYVQEPGATPAKAEITANDNILGLRYTVKTVSGTGSVTIDPKTGVIDPVPASVLEFEITATAPNGKSVTVLVSKPVAP